MANTNLTSATWLGMAESQMKHIEDKTLTQAEAAQFLGVSVGAIEKMVAEIGPPVVNPTAAADEGDLTVPEGTIAEVLEWVGDDPLRAAAALAFEQEQSSPRSTLISQLEAIVNG